jgi:hypothetical protein
VDALLEGPGVLVGGGADPVGEVEDRLDGDARADEEPLEGGQRERAEALDAGDASAPWTAASCRWT